MTPKSCQGPKFPIEYELRQSDPTMHRIFYSALIVSLGLLIAQPLSAQERGRGGRDSGGFGGRGGGGPGGGGPGGGRVRIDANGDGVFDKDEIKQMPETMRSMLESRGIKIKAGTSVDDFRNKMREQFARGTDSGAGPRAGDSQPSAGNRGIYAPNAPFRPRTKERVTIDLPPKYSELDTDFDGQIGLYEWVISKRESLDQFDQIDVNFDGYLTPRELMTFDELAESGEAQVTSYKRERITIIGSVSSASGRGTGRTGDTNATTREGSDRGNFGRGGEGGDRGGFSRGGAPGGDRGGFSRGGAPGGEGGSFGGRGGPPGADRGGFGGRGGPPGGERGGFGGRGGPPGGERGGFGGRGGPPGGDGRRGGDRR